MATKKSHLPITEGLACNLLGKNGLDVQFRFGKLSRGRVYLPTRYYKLCNYLRF